MNWKKEYGNFYFEVGFHEGCKKYYAEVMQVNGRVGDWVGYKGKDFQLFESKEDAFIFLGKYGYHNVGRFILGGKNA
jgi:hypothetical protein